MRKKILLGYSENVLSLLLETFLSHQEKGPVHVYLNQALNDQFHKEFIPPGIEVLIHPVDVSPMEIDKSSFLFGVYTPNIKQKVFSYFNERYGIGKADYFNLVHPSAILASTASLGNGCYVEPLTVISPFAQLGFGVSINRGVTIGHHSRIGDFVSVGPGATIAGHTVIGDNSFIGMGAILFDHVTIGKNCRIGGGSVVTKNIPDNVVAFGNPCRITKNNPVHEQE